MDVLVTGVTGRIGGPVAAALVDAGHTIDVLTRSALPSALDGAVRSVHTGDITDVAAWRSALARAEAVVHMAGISGESDGVMDVNVGSVRALANACDTTDVERVVFASSNCALGHCNRPDDQMFPFRSLPVDETHPVDHVSAYGRSKLIGEQILRAAAEQSSLTVLALRPPWMWRDVEREQRRSQPWDEANWAPSLWAYLAVEDFASAVAAALTCTPDEPFQAMYLSAADTTADAPTAELVGRYLPDLAPQVEHLEGHVSLFSWQQAARILGWRPTRSWRRGTQ